MICEMRTNDQRRLRQLASRGSTSALRVLKVVQRFATFFDIELYNSIFCDSVNTRHAALARSSHAVGEFSRFFSVFLRTSSFSFDPVPCTSSFLQGGVHALKFVLLACHVAVAILNVFIHDSGSSVATACRLRGIVVVTAEK